MPQILLSLGSNVDQENNIRSAVSALAEEFGFMRMSSVYKTAAVGFEGDDFYNLVVALHSELLPSEINAVLKRIEKQQGRSTCEKGFASRKIDIDLVTYGDYAGVLDGVELPRNELHKYAFVLYPIVEIAGEQRCPGSQMTYHGLWMSKQLDSQVLKKIEFDWA
ncbi:MAG: 2-amino-4-hydroxy-6-hydroxymethyldihydropteridine diphosphokinase [Pseudomonadota bacterium]